MMIGFQPNRFWRLCWAFVTPTILTVCLFLLISFSGMRIHAHSLTHTRSHSHAHRHSYTWAHMNMCSPKCLYFHCLLSSSLICNHRGTEEKLLLYSEIEKLFPPSRSRHVTGSHVDCHFKTEAAKFQMCQRLICTEHVHDQ